MRAVTAGGGGRGGGGVECASGLHPGEQGSHPCHKDTLDFTQQTMRVVKASSSRLRCVSVFPLLLTTVYHLRHDDTTSYNTATLYTPALASGNDPRPSLIIASQWVVDGGVGVDGEWMGRERHLALHVVAAGADASQRLVGARAAEQQQVGLEDAVVASLTVGRDQRVLEEGGLTDELLLLTHLLAGVTRLGQFHLQSAERGPHHLTVAEVLTTQHHPEPGRLQLATAHKAYEAPQACPVNKTIVPTRSAQHNTTRAGETHPGFPEEELQVSAAQDAVVLDVARKVHGAGAVHGAMDVHVAVDGVKSAQMRAFSKQPGKASSTVLSGAIGERIDLKHREQQILLRPFGKLRFCLAASERMALTHGSAMRLILSIIQRNSSRCDITREGNPPRAADRISPGLRLGGLEEEREGGREGGGALEELAIALAATHSKTGSMLQWILCRQGLDVALAEVQDLLPQHSAVFMAGSLLDEKQALLQLQHLTGGNPARNQIPRANPRDNGSDNGSSQWSEQNHLQLNVTKTKEL
ncbi:hypothetical protein FQN60_006652 [Etheostoma spectabile]|uniref:Uncharacterized protein n=1 Tax=Etheostoma spectabile TaxID=54343 RepID=A0A5J5CGL2_9PERO|nr:hypothetical protein FQN60_006652 [Etheostoma spectabile]